MRAPATTLARTNTAFTGATRSATSAGQETGWQRFFHPTSVGAVLLAAAVALGTWAGIERPRTVPNYDGSVAGLAFSPYHAGENGISGPGPTDTQIASDLKIAAGMADRIRTYSVRGTLADIPKLAAHLPLSVTLGGFLSPKRAEDATELSRLIQVANANHNVDRVMVGNETLLRGDLSTAELIRDIAQVKKSVHVPVSTAEPYFIWLRHPELVRAVDFITVHLLPYWEGVPERDALRVVMQQYDTLQATYPGKKIVIGEIGWPSNGVDIGGAVASRVNQARFLRGFFNIARARGLDYFVMEAFAQPWKTSFEGRAAGYWGMFNMGRHAKWAMTGPVRESPDYAPWALGGAALAALVALGLLSRRPDIRFEGKLIFATLLQGFFGAMAAMLMTMAATYLSFVPALVWVVLAAFQGLLLFLLTADSFELAETIFGRVMKRRPNVLPSFDTANLPKVSLHLPICNEPPEMVIETLRGLAALDYPDYEVLVIDNNTTDPSLWRPVEAACARLGAKFRFFHLGKFPGYKAGALNFGLRETAPDAQIIGVLDSDYIVSPDWLRCMVPHFTDAKVGFVQSPQDYRDNDGSFFKRAMFWEYAGFFKLGMVTRNERNAIIQHGTMTLVRRTALEANGGWPDYTICEDAALGLDLFKAGWHSVYSDQSFGRGVMPDDFAAFRKQRFRWAYGAMQIFRRNMGALLNPFDQRLTLGQKWHFVTGWLPWVGDALGLGFLALGLVWSALLTAFPRTFEFPVCLFMLPSIGLFVFKVAQILALYAARVRCSMQDRGLAALAGLALSHGIGLAVWKGLVVKTAPFLRTPKMANAPALVQGLVMARQELTLLALSWAALLGVGISHAWATPESRLWCAVLFVQSLPYLASVTVSVLAARQDTATNPGILPAPLPALSFADMRLAAGD